MDGGELEVAVAGRGDGPFLVVAVEPVPEVDVRAVGGADAGDVHDAVAGEAGDPILAVALVGEGPLLGVGAGVVPLVEQRAVGDAAAGGAYHLVTLAAGDGVGAARDGAPAVSPEAELAEVQEGAVAVVGGDVEPVVAVGGGVADVEGPEVGAELEGFVGPRVERGPGGAVVGALELPVLRVARGDEGGADDRVAFDDLRGVRAEVILQRAGRADVEPEGAEVIVEGACRISRCGVGAVAGRAVEGDANQGRGNHGGGELWRIGAGAGGVFGADHVVVGGAGGGGGVYVAGLGRAEVGGEDGVAGTGGGGAEEVVGGGAEGGQPAQGDGLVGAGGEQGGGGGGSGHEAAGAAGVGEVGEGGCIWCGITAGDMNADIDGGRQVAEFGTHGGGPTGAVLGRVAGDDGALAFDFQPVGQREGKRLRAFGPVASAPGRGPAGGAGFDQVAGRLGGHDADPGALRNLADQVVADHQAHLAVL